MNLSKIPIRDDFVDERLPSIEAWPEMFPLDYPDQLNCAITLLDDVVRDGHGDRPCVQDARTHWTYAELLHRANIIAYRLVTEGELLPGQRVLLRGYNSPMLVASWFAVIKAGGIAVTTMALLRSIELRSMIVNAEVSLAICEHDLLAELHKADDGGRIRRTFTFGTEDQHGLDNVENSHTTTSSSNVVTNANDVCLIAFTSGTTGGPKATVHFHRDVLAVCDTFGDAVVDNNPADIFMGTPPLGFTFGLGGLVLFPMRRQSSSVMIAKPTPSVLAQAIEKYRPTILFTSPTAYNAMLNLVDTSFESLRLCISSGEHLPPGTFKAWQDRTGLRLVNVMGSTEMLHAFIAASDHDIEAGALGRVVPGFQACILDDDGRPSPRGQSGRLAVKGPTGCRYLNDERQAQYVVDGWNITGDVCRQDVQDVFWFEMRADDMIVSSGYNIAGPEIEDCLLAHTLVAQCAVIGVPHVQRGQIVKAFVVLVADKPVDVCLVTVLQDYVKSHIAPYKYPREIEFIEDLPRTASGKVQRHRLLAMSQDKLS